MLCTVKPQTLLLQAAAKSTGIPGFKGDQAKRLSCQNHTSCAIRMDPKTSLVAQGNGEAKPLHSGVPSVLQRQTSCPGGLSSSERSSRLCEGCCERGQQGDSNRGWAAWGGGRRRLPAPGCLQGTAQPLPPSE